MYNIASCRCIYQMHATIIWWDKKTVLHPISYFFLWFIFEGLITGRKRGDILSQSRKIYYTYCNASMEL